MREGRERERDADRERQTETERQPGRERLRQKGRERETVKIIIVSEVKQVKLSRREKRYCHCQDTK